MRIAMFSVKPYDQTFFESELQSHNSLVTISYLPVRLTITTVNLAKDSDVVCCFVNDHLDTEVLGRLAKLGVKLIALRCAGFNNVNLSTAKELGIAVCRVPEYSPYSVAEHTVALILDLNRNIHRAHNRIRENDYSLNGLMGFDLHGKTVGVVGSGKIGKAFINIMCGFGTHVLVYDAIEDASVRKVAQYTSLHNLLSHSDIISLHCPLTPSTHHLIDEGALSTMKTGSMLINTSRGGLIDTPQVIKALKSKKLGYLGIDVYEEEADIFFENLSNTAIDDDVFARLQTFPNVTITGHQGFFTKEALNRIAKTTVSNIIEFQKGHFDLVNLVGTE